MSSSHHHHSSSSSSDHHRHHSSSSSSDHHHRHSSSSSDHHRKHHHHRKHRHHRKHKHCFTSDARRTTFGSENLRVVGTIPPNRVELARVTVKCSGVVKLDGVVGWQALEDARILPPNNRVPLLFEIFRNTVDNGNLIFSTLDSAAIIDQTNNGARFVTTGFTTVDARFPFGHGMGVSEMHDHHGTTYILTATAVEAGDVALITGPVVLEATVERRRDKSSSSSSDHHHRHRRHRCHRCHRHRCRCRDHHKKCSSSSDDKKCSSSSSDDHKKRRRCDRCHHHRCRCNIKIVCCPRKRRVCRKRRRRRNC